MSGCVIGDCVRIIWTEQGGPQVEVPIGNEGYGSKLIRSTIETTLGGTIAYEWSKTGALITIQVDSAVLAD